jgi:hypothetical protein
MNQRTSRFLLVLTVVSAFLATSYSSTAFAEEGVKESSAEPAKMLIGAWQLKEAKRPSTPSGIDTRLKLFTGTHWCVIQPDPTSGKIVFQHGGHYSFDGKILSETIDFAGDSTSSLIGKTFKFELRITNDSLEQLDAEGVYTEKWERAKAPASK